VAVTSCTTALHLGLLLLDAGPGDEVIVPSLSFIATANAARYVGATPVFADVDEHTGNLTWECVEQVVTPRTRAVIVVHQGGVPADVHTIREHASRLGIAVLEDAACAAGSTYLDHPVGAGADVACWSFHPRKLLTTGEGGMLTTERDDWAVRARRLREHGMSVGAAERHLSRQPVLEQYLETGFNFRMTDVQAAIGLVQLARLEELVSHRRALAARYQRMLLSVPGVRPVRDPAWGTTNYQSFWVLLQDGFPVGRDELLHCLAAHGISARRGIMAAHREPAYRGHPHPPLPVTDLLTERSLILPLFHTMSARDQERVVAVIADAAVGRTGAA
jgi:perosamine synthetase